ncbi:MAG: branched-chain amino acid ABC transporter permease [Proteobacteria bacterium]|nr:branched-chain amino acid ABC transporter permease [Pseudomonadota bacterium]
MDLTLILQILFSGLIIGGIYALIAVGLNLIYGTMRLLNIAHGELIMVGAYITYWLYTLYGVSPLLSMVLVIALSVLIGLTVCVLIFLPIISTSKSVAILESNSLLIFFGLSIIFTNLASLLWTADIRGYSYMTQIISVAGVPLMYNRLLALGVALVICILCYLLLQKTMLGKAIRALIQDREASQLVGINIKSIYLFSFSIAFAMAGLAGCLLSMFYEITPFMGLPYTIIAFIIIVLGGLGNILGSLLGGFMLGILETIGISLTSPGLRPILSYAIFILIILIRPKGIFGRGIY